MIREASLLPPFIAPRTSARWAIGLLLATVAVSGVAVGVDLAHLRLLAQAKGGASVEYQARWAQFTTASVVVWIQLALFVATAVAFLGWLWQARVNVRALGARRLRFTRGWVLWGFLVPVLNLFRPYQVVREIWQASDPENLDPFGWKGRDLPGLLGLWWLFCVGTISLQVVTLLAGLGPGTSLPRLQLSGGLQLLADLLSAVTAFLSCFLVGRISEAQERKWALVQEREPVAPAGAEASA